MSMTETRVNGRPTLRPYRGPIDHPAMAAVINAALAGNGDPERVSPGQLDNDYAHLTNCDLARDCRVVELDGRIVAYGRTYWVDRTSGERAYEAITNIDPAARNRGVERALLGWQIGRLDELAADAPSDRPAIEVVYVHGTDRPSRSIVEGAGFAVARRHAELIRPNLDDIPYLPLPDGFEVRAIARGDRAMYRRVFDADVRAFQDHWGDVDGSDSAFERFVDDPRFDPPLWRIAFHGDEIAGQILNFLDSADEDGRRIGWTESISVQPEYRRRGLARALLADSLRAVRDAGATCAALGVDTGNPHGALDLYESLGFRIVSDLLELHRPVDAGSDR